VPSSVGVRKEVPQLILSGRPRSRERDAEKSGVSTRRVGMGFGAAGNHRSG